ncbi:MAG TPA: hypothetical protein K8U77_06865, partial [Slackia equolifaciens]|nr:hypothetical protein [Slackia equolifaciens]
ADGRRFASQFVHTLIDHDILAFTAVRRRFWQRSLFDAAGSTEIARAIAMRAGENNSCCKSNAYGVVLWRILQ